ncbi:MAG: hypothetical protein IJF12_00510 [Alphaproteobacteria bacterium]|nr:hypothetical protein [Alphaproteobacteria bacterium]
MRKYFLLSAVALMISGTANAEKYANIEISANISHANKVTCVQNLNFGNIVLDSNDSTAQSITISVNLDGSASLITEKTSGIVSVSGENYGKCNMDLSSLDGRVVNLISQEDTDVSIPVTLQSAYLEDGQDNWALGGTLAIPEGSDLLNDGDYFASILVVSTY